ncbi:RepB family plasmid replication initiator protein [uncultured Acinetobacter sp.]|uniref:RepB family plasmid replication initiator protein n=1 Tax=uncultured Acinetobacter sp. TaxID=165433 RepID=UPI0026156843|nr:RepB family plasmid replication initiator protein [uncultured Acinetobacter sp.]
MTKLLVVKANNIIEASYHLSLNEQRLILAALANMPKGEKVTDDVGYCVTRESFIELGVNPKNASREIREACDRLFNRTITITTEMGTFKTRWVQDVMKYNSDWALANPDFVREMTGSDPYAEDYVLAAIRFSKSVLPFLSNLSSNFTQYFLQDIAGVSSGYSIRFYELMMQFKSTGYRKIKLDDLRNMLELNDKYPLTADLKRWVIDTAIDELNEKSPITIKYQLLKTGRKFTHLELKFEAKDKTSIQLKKDPNTPDFFIKLSDPQRHFFASKMSEMPEMSKYSQGTESYQQFAIRIADMLLQPERFRELYPLLEKAGYN